jgi:branched-chain amino acid transport system substrate-binding protein
MPKKSLKSKFHPMNNFPRILIICLIWTLNFLPLLSDFSYAQTTVQPAIAEKPVYMLDTPAEFTGTSRNFADISGLHAVNIGMFLPSQENPQIVRAAEMAIREYNERGGYRGKKFRLVQRWAENPWMAGSKEMIKLIYEDSVWAIIGSHNGNTTHIAEQVVTKAGISLIAPISSDPTLNYVNIPWMFRLPPDYRIQAKHLYSDGIMRYSGRKIGIISISNHDGRIFSHEMKKVLEDNGAAAIFHFEIPEQSEFKDIVYRIKAFYPDGIVLYLSPDDLKTLIAELNRVNDPLTLYIPWIPGIISNSLKSTNNISIYQLIPFSVSNNAKYASFKNRFFDAYGVIPNARSAYTYDALCLVMNAIKESGLNRMKIRSAIAAGPQASGVTGEISWDNGGGNKTQPVLNFVEIAK